MDIVMTRLVCRNLDYFEGGVLDIDFVAEKRAERFEIEGGAVENLFNTTNKLNVLSFVGINATGKTTALGIVSDLLSVFIGNDSLDPSMRIADYFEDRLEVDSYYYRKDARMLHKLASVIEKDPETGELSFSDERLYSKRAAAKTARKDIFEFEGEFESRADIGGAYLKKEDSMLSGIVNLYPSMRSAIKDMCDTTNRNLLSTISLDLLVPFVQYLDPSVEDLALRPRESGGLSFELKFKHKDRVIRADADELGLYLSSGTIKGINCLSSIAWVFMRGGYLVVDEIENHLNKTIVLNMIDLFASPLNKNGATLVFSTHYSEILDSIDRSDGIYLFEKDEFVRARKFSKAAGRRDRGDKKRSELVIGGAVGSAPSHRGYIELRSNLERFLSEGKGTQLEREAVSEDAR